MTARDRAALVHALTHTPFVVNTGADITPVGGSRPLSGTEANDVADLVFGPDAADESGDLAALIDAGRCRECGTVQNVEPHDEGGIVLVIHTEYQDGLPVGTCGGSLDSAATFTPLYRAPAPSVATPPQETEGRCQVCGDVVTLLLERHRTSLGDVCDGTATERWEHPHADPQAEAGTGNATCRHQGVSLPPSSYLEQEK